MSDAIIEFFKSFITNPFLLGVILSMVPLVELKGAIPYIYVTLSNTAQQASFLNLFYAFGASVVGTSILAPILLIIFIPLIGWLKKTKLFGKFASWVEKHVKKKSDQLEAKANAKAESEENADEEKKRKQIERAKYIGLFVFTAIPLPLTGCWTASCVAALMNLKYGKSLIFIVLGNIVAGIAVSIITAVTYGIFA